jgi:protoporphyrinogen oxidase
MKVAIIGAGATGLAAAHQLTNQGHQVTIFESNSYPGGLAAGFKKQGWNWSLEHYYHHWFASDRYLLSLVSDLGLSSKVIFHSPKSVVFYQNDFYPLDSIPSILAFPGLSLIQKLRFGLVTAHLKYLANWRALEKVTAHQWLTRSYGKHTYQLIWEPLLKGKFNQYYRQVNMAWMWARLKARTSKLGTYQGGFQSFFQDFEAALIKKGVVFRYQESVDKIEQKSEKIIIHSQDRDEAFDHCIVTISPQLFSQITPQLPNYYQKKLSQLKSLGAVMVIYSLKKPLSQKKYYWYNLPKGKLFPYLALVEHTNFASSADFSHEHIIYCGDYCPTDHQHFFLSDKELETLFIKPFTLINPHFKPDWINKSWVFRTKYAQPIPFINHGQHLPQLKTPLSKVTLASMSQVYPWDRGTNFAVKLGIDAAQQVMSSASHEK